MCEKELKAQNKRLKKNYKTYLKLNAGYRNNIRDQHTVWERKLSQQCKLTMNTQYAQIKQGQCAGDGKRSGEVVSIAFLSCRCLN